MAIIKVDYGTVGGGTTHVESTFGGSSQGLYPNEGKISNDGEFTLATYGTSNYYITITKKCTAIVRQYGTTATTAVKNVGDVIDLSYYLTEVLLVDDQ